MTSTKPTSAPDDPYQWLEDVRSDRAMEWVHAHNAVSAQPIESDPLYGELREEMLAAFSRDDRLIVPFLRGDGYFYDFWTDSSHERGLWRRCPRDAFLAGDITWDVLIDLDEVCAAEGASWVWRGAEVRSSDYARALITLSDAGGDATITREFDLTTRRFVPASEGGFVRELGRGSMVWDGDDAVLFTGDRGEGTMGQAGYPITLARLARGAALSEAVEEYRGEPELIGVWTVNQRTSGGTLCHVFAMRGFHDNDHWLRTGDGQLIPINIPTSAELSVEGDWAICTTYDEAPVNGTVYPSGTSLAARTADLLTGNVNWHPVFVPTATTSGESFTSTRDHVVVVMKDDIAHRVEIHTFRDGAWTSRPLDLSTLVPTPDGTEPLLSVSVSALDPTSRDDLWVVAQNFITPATLFRLDLSTPDADPIVMQRGPAMFDATGMTVERKFATSADGTRVPYFLVAPAGMPLDGTTPVCVTGYGGFNISPGLDYRATVGIGALSRGSAYAFTHIRGGGEYGPGWHKAALRDQRHRAYDDFSAVATDLVTTGVSRPELISCSGGSNGGLLVSNMLVLHPDKFGAIVCMVPLTDMRRFHLLLTGSVWMDEYGDPDNPADWEHLRTYSPYHLARRDATYPPIMFVTSTADDRVHPAHARKLAARLEEFGHEIVYRENTEGGHGAANTPTQLAEMTAAIHTFLWQRYRAAQASLKGALTT